MAQTVIWTNSSPEQMARNVQDYQARVIVAIKALAQYFAVKMQGEMRQNAPWEDRTGRARGGLFTLVDDTAATAVTIYLSHTMSYGLWLEIADGGYYAIIMRTIRQNWPEIQRQLTALLS